MVEGVFRAMAVGAVLRLPGDAIGDRGLDLGVKDWVKLVAMAFDTGVLGAAEGHDVNNTGGAGVRAVMAVGAEGVGAQVVHMAAPGLNMTDGAIRWGTVERVVGRFLSGMGDR